MVLLIFTLSFAGAMFAHPFGLRLCLLLASQIIMKNPSWHCYVY